jgi:AraC-like DNA-binding protein
VIVATMSRMVDDAPEQNRLATILDLVQRSLDEPELRGVELARQAYLSRFHFDRLVHAALGEPPGAFRRRLLLERAAHRLTSAQDTVLDIGVEAGYSSAEAFGRAFARAYGCAPNAYRRRRADDHRLAALSGIHFHPPGGLRLPAPERTAAMNTSVLTQMYDHHVWLTGQILDRMHTMDDAVLDRPITVSVEGIDDDPTMRLLAERVVRQLEMWVAAIGGGSYVPSGSTGVDDLAQRFAVAQPLFRAAVVTAVEEGRADETFLDATCVPPRTFSLGGVLAHVLTFAAVRRTMLVGALESAGVGELGAGDPMECVGGVGADASTIERTFA